MAKARAKRTPASASKTTSPRADRTTDPVMGTLRPAPSRLARAPVDQAISGTISTAASRLADRTLLAGTARGLLGGQLTLQRVLGSLVEGARDAADSAGRSARRAAAQQALSVRQVRAELVRLEKKAPRPRAGKNDFVVRGQVLASGGEPVAGLIVEAWDRDLLMNDLLGVSVTDEEGAFRILFPAKAFAEIGEKTPEIVLIVGVEGQPPLHETEPARLEEGQRELVLTVTLPKASGAGPRDPSKRPAAALDERLFRMEFRRSASDVQSRQLSGLMGELQSGLALLLSAIQAPAQPSARKPAARGRAARKA